MDMDNVSDDDAFVSVMHMQKGILQAAAARRGEQEHPRPSRKQLVDNHAMRLSRSQASTAGRSGGGSVMQPFTMVFAEPYYPSLSPYISMTKMPLSDLRLETHHRGRYLLVRNVVEPLQILCITTVVEDEHGDAAVLRLYHQLRPDVTQETPNMVVPAGGVCVIKKPYIELTSDRGYAISIDYLGDVVWLAEDDEAVPAIWRAALRDQTAATLAARRQCRVCGSPLSPSGRSVSL
jgi:hypothetical protein